VHDLAPARDTCEQCHWPTKHVGASCPVRTKFADDEKNTGKQDGAGHERRRPAGHRLHRHPLARGPPALQIRYLTDPAAECLRLEMTNPAGKKVYKTEAAPAGPTEWRTMDCVDCHNRPAHVFYPARQGSHNGWTDGRIDKTCPSSSAKPSVC